MQQLNSRLLTLLGLCLAFWCLAISPGDTITIEKVPNPRETNGTWVTDLANLLNPETETELNQLIGKLEQNQGSELAVITVSETAPSPTPKDFATELFNTWNIGKASQNNGVLFLIAKADRRVEIEVGSGLETILPPETIREIIETHIIPSFQQGEFDQGTLLGTKQLIQYLSQVEKDQPPAWTQVLSGIVLLIILLIYFVMVMITPRSHEQSVNGIIGDPHYYGGGSDNGGFGGGSSEGGGDGGSW